MKRSHSCKGQEPLKYVPSISHAARARGSDINIDDTEIAHRISLKFEDLFLNLKKKITKSQMLVELLSNKLNNECFSQV